MPGRRGPGFCAQKYARLFIDEIDDALTPAEHTQDQRVEHPS
ncbi:hypothetical protein [Streptosporangium sp. NPDC000509]